MSAVSACPGLAAPPSRWLAALGDTATPLAAQLVALYADQAPVWRDRCAGALRRFVELYGDDDRPVVISRCPGQMNIMGMHIDYGGMPSLRLAVRGHDTVTIAAARSDDRARFHSLYGDDGAERTFEPVSFRLADMAAPRPLATRQEVMDYAGRVCTQRERETGSTIDATWGILPQGGLVYLDSWLRRHGHAPRGLDALVVSNVSPSGGMSSSSALVISTAFAALGLHGVHPGRQMSWEDAIDGIGTSEWIRGTRGGTADHGGMVLGRAGRLVSVGVFPARECGWAPLPADYVAVILDSGVPRVYDEAGKEETVLAYPLGTWLVRDRLLPARADRPGWEGLAADFRERIHLIRDINPANLGLGQAQICRLLAAVPERTCLAQMEAEARAAGLGAAYAAMAASDIGQKFPRIGQDTPIWLRRRFTYGLAEQDRVAATIDYLAAGDVATAFELVRLSHAGDRDQEVAAQALEAVAVAAEAGDPRARLAFIPGGYGRMTPAYDRAVSGVNEFLAARGPAAGAVQRLGAGWGGNLGGLISRRFLSGPDRVDLERLLRDELQLSAVDLDGAVATPGQGACLLTPPP